MWSGKFCTQKESDFMAKKEENGFSKLKQDLKKGELGRLYLFFGEESYLREHYLTACKEAIIGDGAFAEFNFFEFDGKSMTPDQLRDAVESYPAMAERKLVMVHDFDLYKMPAAFSDMLPALLSDLPDYICLIFHYDTIEYKPDKRLKIHKILTQYGNSVQFEFLDERQLVDWIRRRCYALERSIDDETARYMIFLCGSSMTNLQTEIEKAAAFSTTGEIKRYHIDTVCIRVMDAVVFDLSDAITERRFDKAIALVDELLAQKNTEVAIFLTIARHIERLYAAKLHEKARGEEKVLLALLGSGSPYYARRIRAAAQRLPENWLRDAVILCGKTDIALKSSAGDRKKQIELTLLEMAAGLERV